MPDTTDETPLFSADLVVTATAYATHPEGADVPPPFPNPALEENQT
jgi:hypothetical protein